MGFEVAADAYGRFMGRYAEPLAPAFAEWSGVEPGLTAVDVGCGPGALTAHLAGLLGPGRVAAVDPSPPFVAAAAARCPGVEVHGGTAEHLPFADRGFDVALAQLVVHFMSDPVAGVRDMARVVRPGGTVAACVWDFAGDRAPLSTFWSAARALDPATEDESGLAGAREGHLGELFDEAGLVDVETGTLEVTVAYPGFADWWEPYTLGVGPAGDHVTALDAARRTALEAACRELLPDGPFEVTATAWAARGVRR